ncbi:uncharacterized protein BDR25DRAFT_356082 [Lindgomyces ingoldianus]|uniref:Uncharacterized protein n=1 Tax=Lindgomyces ingoldianus TaxID=673940 RepID=A0ACB6QUS9_9PLEO|nr:uncharacterized protein BDR25DRAFT_356082 [Lindgomyces ingoldianus]KAF2469837.1 hypothetical protein BDR25DRAFT_356082 [Lindgomyces ingoldianus]
MSQNGLVWPHLTCLEDWQRFVSLTIHSYLSPKPCSQCYPEVWCQAFLECRFFVNRLTASVHFIFQRFDVRSNCAFITMLSFQFFNRTRRREGPPSTMMTTTSKKRKASISFEQQPQPDESHSHLTHGLYKSYKFRSLVQGNEFRLLHVTKISIDEKWEYGIERHVLERAPLFETILYVWGDATGQHTLVLAPNNVGGASESMSINDNLRKQFPRFLGIAARDTYR